MRSDENNGPAPASWWAAPPRKVDWELGFAPPVGGSGRWHAPVASVPWLKSSAVERDPAQPAHGARVTLNLEAPRLVPPIGVLQSDVDPRACGRCIGYTEGFYAAPFDRLAEDEHIVADLPYRPPAAGGTGRWHVRRGDTRWSRPANADEPCCGAAVTLDITGPTLRVPANDTSGDADPRLCRRCMKQAVAPLAAAEN